MTGAIKLYTRRMLWAMDTLAGIKIDLRNHEYLQRDNDYSGVS